ncbi:MAG TPA: enoyl-CoA hydratase/isomerase family protein [Vicinamibacterales bacterium]|jgi:enoyl-CoA hydratase|nr:enoyl-CoA hydratase/isomerase family protein [Vicinamibacterales bacterium]
MTTAETIFEVAPPLALLTFNRPQARNAMTWAMYDALLAACEEVDRNPQVRVFILKGAGGKAFVSGTDISQFQSFRTPQDAIDYEKKISVVLGRLASVTRPTITQVEGFATGAGCGLVATCDLSVATTDSQIGIPIARTLGNVASSGTFARIVNLIGPARAKEMIFTGRLFTAAEAQAIGLFNRVVPKESIESEVMEMARQIASNAPLTIRATKEMTRRLMDAHNPPQGDADLIEMCYMSADFKEGVDAFLNKRKPQWTGT